MVVKMYVLFHVVTEHSHNFKNVAFLQNCVDMCGSCTERCATLSGNGNQFLFVNIDEVADIKVEEDPEPTTSALIKNEPTVSCLCMSVYPVLLTLHVSLSIRLST
jgi:ferredoxin